MKCVEKVDSERENDFLRKLYCVVVFLGFLEMWWRNCRIPPAENSRPAFPCPQWVWSAQFAVTKLQSYKDCKVTKLQPQHGHDITLTRHLSSNLADKRKREQEEFLKIACDKKLPLAIADSLLCHCFILLHLYSIGWGWYICDKTSVNIYYSAWHIAISSASSVVI